MVELRGLFGSSRDRNAEACCCANGAVFAGTVLEPIINTDILELALRFLFPTLGFPLGLNFTGDSLSKVDAILAGIFLPEFSKSNVKSSRLGWSGRLRCKDDA